MNLSDYSYSRLNRYFEPYCKSWFASTGSIDPDISKSFLPFLLHGCFEAALHNIGLTDEEWKRVQSVIDTGINAALAQARTR